MNGRHQRRASAATAAERSERRGHQRRAECEGGVAGAGEAVVAEQVTDEQREHCDDSGDRRLAGNLGQPQRRDRAPLQCGTIQRGVGEAHC